ncbi:BEN domain-containing protein 6 isoform X2 [Fukomys damarensis]|uniref:BEN domain-containing protein 6 isoform X2 n=1 Tax=Fukomys damarensis TaxID=885580 RepID=UPI0005402F01|nr:BEN domain-containing protein 6 isoform X2 [Fukomys damarensis]
MPDIKTSLLPDDCYYRIRTNIKLLRNVAADLLPVSSGTYSVCVVKGNVFFLSLVLETMMRKSLTRMRTTLRTYLKRLQKMSEEDEQEIDAVERLRSELGEKFETDMNILQMIQFKIEKWQIARCNKNKPQKFINDLMQVLYTNEYMTTHSLTGAKSSTSKDKAVKPAMNQNEVQEIIGVTKQLFPNTDDVSIRRMIGQKLNNCTKKPNILNVSKRKDFHHAANTGLQWTSVPSLAFSIFRFSEREGQSQPKRVQQKCQ